MLGLLSLLLGCSGFESPESVSMTYGTMTDARDGQVYRTVNIASMTWMQKALNFEAPGSKCPDTLSTCTLRLYPWSMAMDVDAQFDTVLLGVDSGFRKGICPTGWHLPSVTEWNQLYQVMNRLGDYGNWASGDGTGFELRGWQGSSASGMTGAYWTPEGVGSDSARSTGFGVSYNMIGSKGNLSEIGRNTPKAFKLGVRCLKDGAI